jgi:hypothetical protein
MEWISFFEKQPKDYQEIFYYGEYIGVWYGHYEYHPDDLCSPHIIICHESAGIVDRMDVPWWMPYEEGMIKPEKPSRPVPPDYPSG